MSQENKGTYILQSGWDSGFTSQIYNIYYINEKNEKRFITLRYKDLNNPNDENEALKWFEKIAANHNSQLTNEQINDSVMATINASDFKVSETKATESINYDDIYDYIFDLIEDELSNIADYIEPLDISNYSKTRFSENIINKLKNEFNARPTEH